MPPPRPPSDDDDQGVLPDFDAGTSPPATTGVRTPAEGASAAAATSPTSSPLSIAADAWEPAPRAHALELDGPVGYSAGALQLGEHGEVISDGARGWDLHEPEGESAPDVGHAERGHWTLSKASVAAIANALGQITLQVGHGQGHDWITPEIFLSAPRQADDDEATEPWAGHRVLVHPPADGLLEPLLRRAGRLAAAKGSWAVVLGAQRHAATLDLSEIAHVQALPTAWNLLGLTIAGEQSAERPPPRLRRYDDNEAPFLLWHCCLAQRREPLQAAMYETRRALRHELQHHLQTRVKGEDFDSGHAQMIWQDIRRAATSAERQLEAPHVYPSARFPAQLAAGDPYHDVPLPKDSLRLDYVARKWSPEEQRIGRERVLMQGVAAEAAAVGWAPILADMVVGALHIIAAAELLGQPVRPAAQHDMKRIAYFRVPTRTARRFPKTEFHLDDDCKEDHMARCVASSRSRQAEVSAALAAHAATAAAAAVQEHVTEPWTVRDELDRDPCPHAPLNLFALEDLHMRHCRLCREAPWRQHGRDGHREPGGIRHHCSCYFHRSYQRNGYGLWYDWDAEPTRGSDGKAPLPNAQMPKPINPWTPKVDEHAAAAEKGLRKWDQTPFATRPLFALDKSAASEGRGEKVFDPVYDLPVRMVENSKGVLQPERFMRYNLAFKRREEWEHKVHGGAPPKARVCSGLHLEHNDCCRKPRFAYSGSRWVTQTIKPGFKGAVDDLQSYFPHLPLHPMRRDTQVYCDHKTGEWRTFVNYGFGSKLSPFYASQGSCEVAAGLRGTADMCAERFVRLMRDAGEFGWDPPALVIWRWRGGDVNFYVDDAASLGPVVTLSDGARVDTAAVAQQMLQRLARELRLQINPEKSSPSAHTFEYLGLLYDTLAPRGSGRRGEVCCVVKLPEARRELTADILEYLLAQREPPDAEELKSIVGIGIWISAVQRGARAFLMETELHTHRMAARDHRRQKATPLPEKVRAEWAWWLQRLRDKSWTGSRILELRAVQPVLIRSDAAGEDGHGYFVVPDAETDVDQVLWGQRPWRPGERDWSSTAKELVPAAEALDKHAADWRGREIMFLFDNAGSQSIVNTGRSYDPNGRPLIKRMLALALEHDLELSAGYTYRGNNVCADALSRQKHLLEAWRMEDGQQPGLQRRVRPRPTTRDEERWSTGDLRVVDLCSGINGHGDGAEAARGADLGPRWPDARGRRVRVVLSVDGCASNVYFARQWADHPVVRADLLASSSPAHLRRAKDAGLKYASADLVELLQRSTAHGVLASPPCQLRCPLARYNKKRYKPADARASVAAAIVEAVLRTDMSFLIMENAVGFAFQEVTRPCYSDKAVAKFDPCPELANAIDLLPKDQDWCVGAVAVNNSELGGAQMRRRSITLLWKGRPPPGQDFTDLMRDFAAERAAQRESQSVRQRLPHVGDAYYHRVYDEAKMSASVSSDGPSRALVSTCLDHPRPDAQGRRKVRCAEISVPPVQVRGKDGRWHDNVSFFGVDDVAALFGMPAGRPWPPADAMCWCKYCANPGGAEMPAVKHDGGKDCIWCLHCGRDFCRCRARPMAAKCKRWSTLRSHQLGNSVPRALGRLVGELLLAAESTSPTPLCTA